MALDRTFVNGLQDDDGSGLTGSVWDKADIIQIYDDIDEAAAFINAQNTFANGQTINTASSPDLRLQLRLANTTIGAFGTDGHVLGTGANNVAVFAETGRDIKFYTNGSTSTPARIGTAGEVFERGRTVAMGTWQGYTPTWTNLTMGDGAEAAKYMRVGKTVWVTVSIAFGSTTSISGSVFVSLPSDMANPLDSTSPFHLLMIDNDTNSAYGGQTYKSAAGTVRLLAAGSPLAGVSATAPFTWANGDRLFLWGTYEEA
jgi:hypothetical protein